MGGNTRPLQPPAPPNIAILKSNMHLCTMRTFCSISLALAAASVFGQWRFSGDTTPSWHAVIQRYSQLAEAHREATLIPIGKDDGGQPIHLFVVHDGTSATPQSAREAGKNILFIINGIHPGEPDGIDASLLLARSLLESDQLMGLTAKTTVCIIPLLNVSGALERTRFARPDQNGPEEHGRRVNALGLDLNRDMTKLDSRNAQALVQALRRWDPDLLIDTHVSNGADHRYVMELLTTQKDKLEAPLDRFLTKDLIPDLYAWMDRKGIAMCPYFETIKEVPDSGITGFMDSPRYTTGYAALFGTLGIMAESHMLKPYAERVNATYQLMLGCLAVLDNKGADLREARKRAAQGAEERMAWPIHWELDTTIHESFAWKGYQATYVPSRVSGLPRLRYDTAVPVDILIDRYDHFVPSVTVTRPKAYLIPQAWKEVILRLAMNGVPMERLAKDTLLPCEVYHFTQMSTATSPQEGRYPHSNVRCELKSELVTARSGDLVVALGGATDRYVIEVLEPQGDDSFFAWGFFDSILQQKEWFSSYAFEDIAADHLENDTLLREELENRKKSDAAFAADGEAQLLFIYRHSPHMEPAYHRYPIARILP